MNKIFITTLFVFTFLLCFESTGQKIPRPNINAPNGVEVNSFTGNLFLQRTDMVIAARGGLAIDVSFSYNRSRDTIDRGFGLGWSFQYDQHYTIKGDTVTIVRSDGRRDVFKKSNNVYRSPTGVYDTLEALNSGTAFRLTTKHGMKYLFNDPIHKKLTRVEDLNNNFIDMTYQSSKINTLTNSAGRTVSFSWASNRLVGVTDNSTNPRRTYTYEYTNNRLTKVTNPLGNSKTYGYVSLRDNGINLITDDNGNPVKLTYNAGKVQTIASCISEMKITYQTGHTYLQESSASGVLITDYVFDAGGKLSEVINPNGNSIKYRYDANNNIIGTTDFLNNNATATYDADGNKLTENDALGNGAILAYTPLSKIASVRDKRGNTTSFTYDAQGKLTQTAQPLGITETYTYDTYGNILSKKNGNNQTINYEYDGLGNLSTVKYPLATERHEYDALGRKIKSIDANGNFSTFAYDPLSRLTKVTDALGNAIQYAYDANGNITKETDPNGNAKSMKYDAYNRLIEVTIPAGTARYEYDALSNLTKISDLNGHFTKLDYNSQNLLIKETDPIGNITTYTYDANGNLKTKTDPNGTIIAYEYDVLNRLTKRTYGSKIDQFTYDVSGNMLTAINNDISLTFTYDALNRLTRKTVNNWNKSVSYTYDNNGNRKTMTDPDGGVTAYTYDNNNRLTELKNPANLITGFVYDSTGRMTRQNNSNGTYTTYQYDAGNRLTKIAHFTSTNTILASYAYTFDKLGNRKTMTDKDGKIHQYSYDGSYRVTNVLYGNGDTEGYNYDAFGNRKSLNRNGANTNYTYNNADQLLSAGTAAYTFDKNGNMTTKTDSGRTTTYQYDAQNRLVKVLFPDATTNEFAYDPMGNRISLKGKSGETTQFFLDNQNVLMELSGTGTTQARYTAGLILDSWLGMERGGSNYVYHKDGINSTIALTGTGQQMAAQYEYDIFGQMKNQQETVTNYFKYTGLISDKETQLYYYRTRYYDNANGRFMTKDKFHGSHPLDMNRYAYVNGNPVNLRDPDGKIGILPVVIGAAGIIGLGAIYGAYKYGKSLENFATKMDPYNREFQEIDKKLSEDNLDILDEANLHGEKNDNTKGQAEEALKEIPKVAEATYDAYGSFTPPAARPIKKIFNAFKYSYKALKYAYNKAEELGDFLGDYIYDSSNDSGSEEDIFVPDSPTNPPVPIDIPTVQSQDPNDITGPLGYAPPQYIAAKSKMDYTIRFENDPKFATAPAQRVTVSLPIDAKLNPFQFQLGEFGFGRFTFSVPSGVSSYSKRLDVRDSLGIFVDVTAGIDATTRKAFWIFQSIDPATGLAPLDAQTGFLPVNDTMQIDSINQKGEGFVRFSIKPASNAVTGDTLKAIASIVFDDNPAISTNLWKNVVDAGTPTSRTISAVKNNAEASIKLTWQGRDDTRGSGVARYAVYAAKNTEPFALIAPNIDTTVYTFFGESGQTYQFFTRATDNVGNEEPLKTNADTTLTLGEKPSLKLFAPIASSVFCPRGQVQILWQAKQVSTVNLTLSIDGGNTFRSIATNIASTNYNWNLPDSLTGVGNCLIRVSAVGGDSLADYSNVFSVMRKDTAFVESITCNPLLRTDTVRLFNRFGCDSTVIRRYNYRAIDTTLIVNITCQADSAGRKVVRLIGALGCDSIVVKVLVYRPITKPIITRSNDTLMSSFGVTYRWFRNDTLLVGAAQQKITATIAGLYKVETTTEFGCIALSDAFPLQVNGNRFQISLKQGWNTLSSYVKPTNADMLTVLSGVAPAIALLKDGKGKTTIPSLNLNQVGNWDVLQGYQIKAERDTVLTINGNSVQSNTVIPIVKGWQIIPYLKVAPSTVAASVGSYSNRIVILKDNAGRVYIPSLGINNIDSLRPTQGYWLKAEIDTSLKYAAITRYDNEKIGVPVYRSLRASKHFQYGYASTGSNATLVLPQETVSGQLEIGDEIGVFTSTGTLCGVGVYNDAHLAISIWGDDIAPFTTKEGLLPREKYTLKVWNRLTNEELSTKFTLTEGRPFFEINGLYIVSEIQMGNKLGMR